jgi:outer membrane protein TolC
VTKPTLKGSLLRLTVTAPLMFTSGCYMFQPQTSPGPTVAWTPPTEIVERKQPKRDVEVPPPNDDSLNKLDLALAVEIASQNNPDTRASWYAAAAAAGAKGAAYSSYYPEISVSAALTNERSDFAGNPVVIKRTTNQPAFELNYTLLDFGSRAASARSAGETLNSANFQFNRRLQELTFLVEDRYFRLYAAEASVDAGEENLKDAKQSLDAARKNYEVGLKPKQDLLQAEANFRKAEFDLETAKATVEDARGSLARVLGVQVSSNLEIDPPDFSRWRDYQGDSVTTRIEEALKTRPDLLAAQANARGRAADIEVVWGEALPKLVARADGRINDVHGQREDEENYNLELAIETPLFSGFRQYYLAQQARAETQKALEAARATEVGIAAEVWKSFYGLQAAERKLRSAEALVSASLESYRAVQKGYDNGANSLLDLVAAQRELANARNTLVGSKAELAISLAELAFTTGRLPELPEKTFPLTVQQTEKATNE